MSDNQFKHQSDLKVTPKKSGFKSILLALFLVGGAFIAGFFFYQQSGREVKPTGVSQASRLDLTLFWEVLELIDRNYIDGGQISREDLLYGAISGMVEAIGDPYTAFFTPGENSNFKDSLDGVYEGIGAQLGFKDSQLVVIAPLEGSPAEEAGIKAGDAIWAVNGESTAGWSLAKAVQKIRGEANTLVTLTLADGNVELTRRQIKIPAVRLSWETLGEESEGKVAHIRVLRFGSDTIQEWNQIVTDVVRNQGQGVILDVRNNPGGFFNAAVYLASEFFRNGTVVKKATISDTVEFKVDHQCRFCDLPVVVLINEGSASASEILAGAIHRRQRGQLVGQQSFGKGTVQESIELEQGAAIHITNAKWLLPDGENITEQGLTPDYEVETSTPSGPFGDGEGDEQLQKAIEVLSTTP